MIYCKSGVAATMTHQASTSIVGATLAVNPLQLSPKRRNHSKRRSLSDILRYEHKPGSERNFFMYSLRHIALTDKISQHVSIEVFTQIYPPEVIHSLLEHDPHIQQKQ